MWGVPGALGAPSAFPSPPIPLTALAPFFAARAGPVAAVTSLPAPSGGKSQRWRGPPPWPLLWETNDSFRVLSLGKSLQNSGERQEE